MTPAVESHPVVLATPAPLTHRTAEESLGLQSLTAVLRNKGYVVHLVDGWLEGLSPALLAKRIAAVGHPLWVGFSCYRSNMGRAVETMSMLRAQGLTAPMVAGGYGPTFEPEIFLKAGFDLVALGEAERTVLQISQHYRSGAPAISTIGGVAYMQDGRVVETGPPERIVDLDQLPFPARDTMHLSLARRSAVNVEASRGCRAACIFCSIVAFARVTGGDRWRQKSIERIVRELENLWMQGVKVVKVIDDSLIEPPRDSTWAAALADALEDRGVKLRMRGSIRADRATPEVLFHLRRAGFFAFSCGIESFSTTALKRMAKSASLTTNIQALQDFHHLGLYVQAGHILFDRETTMTELVDNLGAMKQFYWTITKGIFTEMFAAAGTPLTKLLRKRKALTAHFDSMNESYEIRDQNVRVVYGALKRWQRSHSAIYDQAIDVLNAPKSISAEHYAHFHDLFIELKQLDLVIFEGVLGEARASDAEARAMDYVERQISNNVGWYSNFKRRLDGAYAEAGLIYDAVENPFLC